MTSLFAESHNMVAILKKSDAAEGFEQIIDFLSGSYINHALTVNPHVYISCIKQFWNTAVVKRSGDVTMLQALVDKKRIVITEEVVCEILQFNDAEGVICLPNEEIFAGLARMGYEKPTSWNEFSSAMASALICLSSGQRFNFSNDSPLLGVNTPRSDEDRLELMELMVFVLKKDICDEFELNASRLSKFLLSGKSVIKRSGDVTRLQALVDKKRIVISEEVVREILQLNDVEGVVCLPNEEIFAGLARMGYEKPSTKLTFYNAFFSTQWKFFIHTILHSLSAKRTSWNEFSSAMASALICLSSGQRFNFSKYIFESLVCNVDSTSKFYIYPRVGKGFSGVETPLFENMLAVRAVDAEEEVQVPTQDDVVQEHVIEEIDTEVVPPTPTSPSPPSPVLDKCSTLVLRVEGLENANAAQQLEIIKLKSRVKKLERLNKGRISVDIDEGVELVVDQEKDAEIEGRHADTQAEIYNIDLDHSSKVVAASTPIPATKPAAKPKVLKIAVAPVGSTRKRKGFAAKRKKLSEEAQEADDLRRRLEIFQYEDDDVFVEAIPLAQKDAIWRNQKSVHGLALVKRWKLLTSCGVHVIIISTVQLFLLVERRSKENTKCVSAANEELTDAKHKLMLLI
nr:glutamic acid-rich protein-like [Tanacetum cinerariifolium]